MSELHNYVLKIAKARDPHELVRLFSMLKRSTLSERDKKRLRRLLADFLWIAGEKWIQINTAEQNIPQEALAPFLENTRSNIDRLRRVASQISRLPASIGERLLRKKFDVIGQYSFTYMNTLQLVSVRASSWNMAIQSGVSLFQYVGPQNNIREFCAAHLGRIYTAEEILRMDNGQGLPVQYYCGGWNCRHRWIPVV